MDNSERLEVVLGGLPLANQINGIVLTEEDAVRFTWGQATYRVSGDYFAEEVGEGVLIRSDKSILLQELLKKTLLLKQT